MSKIEIRKECSSDNMAIYSVTKEAFDGMAYAGGDEQDIVDRLRASSALSLSLVALRAESLIGHIAFSPVIAQDGSQPWFALGPVSVLPRHQGQGVGAQLINQGLAQIEAQGALGCVLTGNPDYYKKFGFEFSPSNVPEGEAAEYFMIKRFTNYKSKGALYFNKAFYGDI